MRNWNGLKLMLPLGLAMAAYAPLRLVCAANLTPTAIQAALRVGPGETTPHFFTGDTRLSSFQRLPEPTLHTLQPAAVTAAPAPNVDARPVEQLQLQAPPKAQIAEPVLALGKPIDWEGVRRIDAHFFPKHSPISNASDFGPVVPAGEAGLANLSLPTAARLRTTEIQPVGAAQVAIAPAPPALPPAPQAVQPPSQFASMPMVQVAPRPPVPALAAAPEPALAAPPTPSPPPPELTAPAAKMVAFENKRLRGAHFFGPMRFASLERQPNTLQEPPLKEALVKPAVAPNLPPAGPAETAPPQIAPRQLAAVPPEAMKPQHTSLLLPTQSRLSPTAVAVLPPPSVSLTPIGPELTSLSIPGHEPINPLVPTEVLPAAGPAPLREQFQLTSLQPLPAPGANLQPTEVLPIPTPNSPTAPRVPALDAERPINALTTAITAPSGRLPTDVAIERFRGDYPAYLPRGWEDSVYFWEAPTMCIGALRYEEVNLERYGYSHCPAVQPVLSGMHFLVATMALPYSLAAHPPGTCQYPLGHYRPGSDVPFRHIRPAPRPWPISAECMAVAGLILLIP